MGSVRKNYNKSFQQVQDRFTGEAGKLFETEHHGRECTNAIFIRVLFCALCHIQSLFAICRNLQRCPDDRTVAAAILKTLPTYWFVKAKTSCCQFTTTLEKKQPLGIYST